MVALEHTRTKTNILIQGSLGYKVISCTIHSTIKIFQMSCTLYVGQESCNELWPRSLGQFVTIYYTIKIYYMYFTEWNLGVMTGCH